MLDVQAKRCEQKFCIVMSILVAIRSTSSFIISSSIVIIIISWSVVVIISIIVIIKDLVDLSHV